MSGAKTALIATISFIAGGLFSQLANDAISSGIKLQDLTFVANRSDSMAPQHENGTSAFTPTHNEHPYPTSVPIAQEIVPPELYKYHYHPGALRFNVSRSMLRRSRPIVGNNERLHAYIKKLHSKQCTVVLFLGGSITDGHNVRGGFEMAYPKHFWFWLNDKYPCVNEDGSEGKHSIKRTFAQNSQTHFIHWSSVSELDKIDLVFLEFNVVSDDHDFECPNHEFCF
jgi:hypothetical protein